MTELSKVTVTSIKQFIQVAHEQGYMTISKDYGILASDGERVTGELITEGPKGPIDPKDYKGYMKIEE